MRTLHGLQDIRNNFSGDFGARNLSVAFAEAEQRRKALFSKAKSDLQTLGQDIGKKDFLGDAVNGFLAAVEQAKEKIKQEILAGRRGGTFVPPEKRNQSGGSNTDLSGSGTGSGSAANRIPQLREQFNAELALLKSSLDQQDRLIEVNLRGRLIDEDQYWREKARIRRQQLDVEEREIGQKLAAQEDLLRRLQQAPGVDATQIDQARNAVAQLQVELTALTGQRRVVELELKVDRDKARQELDNAIADALLQVATITATDTPELRRAAVERSFQDLLAQVSGDAAATNLIGRLIDVKAADAELTALEARWRLALENMRNAETSANIQSEQGLISQFTAQQQIGDARAQASIELQNLLPRMQQVAAAIGPEAVARVAAFKNELAGLQPVLSPLQNAIANQLAGAFTNLFDDLISGTKSAKQAFLDFVVSFLKGVAQILLQQAVLAAVKFAFGAAGGAADGGPVKKAEGGPVFGAGSATSDSIPAYLSDGEYVIRAASVRHFGIAMLDSINAIKYSPAKLSGRLAFAAGGLVPNAAPPAPASPARGLRIINVIDPKMARDYLDSADGSETIFNILERNPGRVQQLARF